MNTDIDREQLIRSLLPMVRRIALRVRRVVPRADLGDLIGDGSIGLIRAVDAFDPNRGTPLERYARKVIAGTMLNGIRRMDPVSERARRVLREVEHERYRLAAAQGTMPSAAQIAQRRPDWRRAESILYRALPLSLDAPLPQGERLPTDAGSDPAQIIDENEERAYMRALVDSLPERQRRLMLAHYYGSASLRRISTVLNISPQRASQLHLSAIAKLRKAIDVPAD